ncbi:8-oxo-dGTP diphosphatase [Lactobacillus xylocopicola]|uniref:7,8-dihydro-8-oxoguanine triphosphatase n=1 Tax=Lactobacillus xylocopicola TaxID=2976676 RepID=A0ABN6SJX8_9LACO|nr:8-oxo-dGTP diphosphatase [Lactobacillus xylocopicola]BDR60530.1 7,8-dihydro-8-oxoguanine triphosphatase [Lactobacillus xylocopicola]
MDRTERVTLTNMCMITANHQILVLDRKDPTWPGLTFPGGHVEAHESFHDAVVREVKEETNLTITDPRLCGLKQFYDDQNQRYLVFFYIATKFQGTVKSSPEGNLTWMTQEELLTHQLAENFDRDLLVYFDQTRQEHLLDGERDEPF